MRHIRVIGEGLFDEAIFRIALAGFDPVVGAVGFVLAG